MRNIHEHISRLLFDHECVIVPGFGAFLSRYYAAEVNPATHMMRPPSRRLYFNKSIKENDGLLAKSISLQDKVRYEKAMAFIKEQVKDWTEQLEKGQKIRLTGIGRLFIDDHKSLQFSPSLENNYERSSYGLSIFRSPAIHREVAIRQNIQKSIERHIQPEKVAEIKNRRRKRLAWAAVLAPVLFAGVVGSAYLAYQNDQLNDFAGINWFEIAKDDSEKPVEKNISEKAASPADKEIEVPASTERPAAEEITEPEEAVESIPVKAIYPYHIIVGSFRENTNASFYIDQLQAKGYDAYLADGDRRFNRVAIGNFATLDQARNALQGIKLNLNSGAWIYRN